MKWLQIILCLLFFEGTALSQASNLGEQYIQEWKKFYPSKAVAQGMHASIFDYEDFSERTLQQWIAYNRQMKQRLVDKTSIYAKQQPIDARLLRNQIAKELEKWNVEKKQQVSLTLYTDLINHALKEVKEATYLTQQDQDLIVCQRLLAIQRLCAAAQQNLKFIDQEEAEQEVAKLKETATSLRQLPSRLSGNCTAYEQAMNAVQSSIVSLIDQVYQLPPVEHTDLLGTAEYDRKLGLYTDSPLTSEALAKLAIMEIHTVKKLIGEVAVDYYKKTYSHQTPSKEVNDIIKIAFADMEKDAPESGAEYLAFWQDLSDAAIQFIEDQQVATLPEFQTLQILPAPESAGPAARIGWVASAPPFAPNPLTTLYLPSIPDTLPKQEQIDFWSSFNKPFNRMIVIHELFPGHYMQIKISRETPHRVRLLFPYAPYFEGYATFAERVCLDKGWEKDNPLTFLAHLCKRLENANRAYTSVQVHCNNWTKEQVMDFSTNTSLLAPQFAKSLWGRIMRSPMQLTSYFWGGQQFTKLLEREQKRLGASFVLKDFMDTILKAGAIHIEEFDRLLAK